MQPARLDLGRVVYWEPHLEKRHQVEFKRKRKRTGSCLTEGGNRQLAASFGSGGCQCPGEMVSTGSGLKRGGDHLGLKRPSSI